jgi:3-oxoadipate CoA-transferase beta subunit
MITSGRIDYVLLGAFQVDTHGDFAGWATDDPDRLPAPGASMELARYAKNVYILMTHLDKNGQSKIMDTCTYPVTARGVVKRIYTDLATLEVTPNGLKIIDIHNGMSHDELEIITGVKLL